MLFFFDMVFSQISVVRTSRTGVKIEFVRLSIKSSVVGDENFLEHKKKVGLSGSQRTNLSYHFDLYAHFLTISSVFPTHIAK